MQQMKVISPLNSRQTQLQQLVQNTHLFDEYYTQYMAHMKLWFWSPWKQQKQTTFYYSRAHGNSIAKWCYQIHFFLQILFYFNEKLDFSLRLFFKQTENQSINTFGLLVWLNRYYAVQQQNFLYYNQLSTMCILQICK